MDIRPLDPFDDDQMRRFHEIGWRAEREDGRPWNGFWTYDEMAGVLREPIADHRMEGVCAYDGDQMVGGGIVGMSQLDNLDKAWVFPAVEPELRGRGIGGALVEALVRRVREEGRTQVLCTAAVPFAERRTSGVLRFAEAHGFTLSNTEIYRILSLPVDDGMLAKLREDSASHHPDHAIETYVDEIPERYLPSYAHLRNQLALDAPTGEVEFEAERTTAEIAREHLARNRRMGRTTYVTLAVKDGEAVAHSDLFVAPTGNHAFQMGTLVRRDQRGHRLGMAVKVANLEALQRDRPDITEVHTQNAETNAWMVSINETLGFAPVGVCPDFKRDL